MLTRPKKAYSNDSGSSGKPSQSHQSSWMPRWNQLPRKHRSLIVPHSQTVCKEQVLSHHKKKRMCTSLNLASDIPSYIRMRKDSSDSEPLGLIGHNALGPRVGNSSSDAIHQSCRKRSRSSMLVLGTGGSDMQAQSDEDDPVKDMVVSTRFGNCNFATQGDGSSKYEKYSAILVDERNAFSALLSRDVCNLPLFSQTKTRSFLITKRMGFDVSNPTHHGGVKLQPLWSSTDSEFDTQMLEADISCEPSTAETNKRMNVVAISYKKDSFGEPSPSLVKVSQHETLHTASVDPKEENARGKLRNTSSKVSLEQSSSRTQSLEAEHFESKSTAYKNEEEASTRWVKRLKPSSSEVGESSSHNRLSPDADESMVKGEPPSRNDSVLQSCWIQRWCQNHSVRRYCEGAMVKCEPDSSKLALDEAEKKQFPSIAAMALMGKSMSGFRPCKLTKRGPLVIWNTDDN